MSRLSSPKEQAALDRLSKSPVTRESFRETILFFRYVLPYRRRLLLGLVFLVFGAGFALLFPLLSGYLIDAALRPGGAVIPGLGSLTLNQIAATLAVTITLQATAAFIATWSFNVVGQKTLADIRRETYTRLIGLPMVFFAARRVGELASRVSTDIAQIEGALIEALPQLCRQSAILAGGIVLISLTSGNLTLVMLSSLPLLIAAAVVFGRRLRSLSRDTQDRLAETSTIVEETLQAIASVKAFANERFELGRYEKVNTAVLSAALRTARWRAGFVAFFIAALFGGILIVLWYGAHLLQTGHEVLLALLAGLKRRSW